MRDHPYREAGRRLKAAFVSYRLGRASVDRTLKRVPYNPGEGWEKLAEDLDRQLAEETAELLDPFARCPKTIQ